MSRHRNIRNLDLDEELDDYDEDEDYYGKSYEEEPMSPSTAKFLYQRPRFTSNSFGQGTRLDEYIPEEEPSGSASAHHDEIFHLEEETKPVEKPSPTEPTSNQNIKLNIPSIQQLKIAEQKQTRSGSKSPARKEKENSEKAPVATVPKLNAIDLALAATPVYNKKKRPSGTKESINLVVIGHVDAGKSTLMGHLLFQLGHVDQKILHKYKQEASRSGKSSFFYAWILDETEEERVRGVTMDIARASFEAEHRKINILDAPGHKDFIPNMITGAAIADAALLVVNSTRGEFETGFDQGGQTREHAMLARALGVNNLVVAVNKLDTMDWSKERYDEVANSLKHFLQKHAGFPNITFVPISGLNGDNLTKKPDSDHPLRKWYDGPTLVDILDQLTVPQRSEDLPLRIVVNDVLSIKSNLVQLSAKIENGHIEAGEKVYIMPKADPAVIKAVTSDDSGSSSDVCYSGDQVMISLSGTFEPESVWPGCIICRGGSECLVPIKKFVARVVTFDITIPILIGTKAELFSHSMQVPCVITQLKSVLNKSTGKVITEKPRCLTKNSSAIVVIETDTPVNLEPYAKCKSSMGRINLRSNGKTIAAGVVVEAT